MPIEFDSSATQFPEGYKDEIKNLWYRAGKVNSARLSQLAPIDPITNKKPSNKTLDLWIKEWADWAEELDNLVVLEMQGRLVQEKVAMFERFTEVGQEMQNIALTWLHENEKKINAISAVRLLVDGVRIEQEARGVPQVLRKMITATDEDLMKRIKELASKAPALMETMEEDAEI